MENLPIHREKCVGLELQHCGWLQLLLWALTPHLLQSCFTSEGQCRACQLLSCAGDLAPLDAQLSSLPSAFLFFLFIVLFLLLLFLFSSPLYPSSFSSFFLHLFSSSYSFFFIVFLFLCSCFLFFLFVSLFLFLLFFFDFVLFFILNNEKYFCFSCLVKKPFFF